MGKRPENPSPPNEAGTTDAAAILAKTAKATGDAQETPLQYLPPVVLSRPTSRHQAAGVLGAVVPGGAAGADAGLVAST